MESENTTVEETPSLANEVTKTALLSAATTAGMIGGIALVYKIKSLMDARKNRNPEVVEE